MHRFELEEQPGSETAAMVATRVAGTCDDFLIVSIQSFVCYLKKTKAVTIEPWTGL